MDALLHCRNHADRPATTWCDECRPLYCRECAAERWITSRSSVWVCNRRAGGWRPTTAARPGGVAVPSLGWYAPLGAAVALAAAITLFGGLLGR